MINQEINLEVFPFEKTCPQGCPPCPLANRGGKISPTTKIDKNVQKSFWAFEKFLEKKGLTYNLFYAGPNDNQPFDLFPRMRNHALVSHLGSVNLSKVDSSSDVDQLVSDTFQKIEWYSKTFFSQKLEGIRISMVPEKLFVEQFEKRLIEGLAEKVFSSELLEEYGEFRFEIRSNLVPKKNLDRDLTTIEIRNGLYLGSLVNDLWKQGGGTGMRGLETHYEPDNGKFSLSYAEYFAEINKLGHRIKVTKRVLANSENKIDKDFLIEQAIGSLTRDTLHFALAPQGVMCNHSSVAINNPILWMSHETFQREIGGYLAKKVGDRVNLLGEILIIENKRIFENAPDEKRTVPEWIAYFDEVRASPDFKRLVKSK